MSIERFLMVNLASDLLLLAVAARVLGCLNWRRLLAADALCAAYAVLAVIRPIPWSSPAVQLALLGATACLLTGGRLPLACRVAALLAGGALISGGTAALLRLHGGNMAGACAGTGAAVIALMLSARHPLRDVWQISVALRIGDKTIRFPALIDTGNRLREPVSGQPVLIAEAELLRGALPQSGWRMLRYGAVGGEGSMACFRPESVWIERGRRRRRAPDVWIAVTPRPLPGPARALAPCEFAAYFR